MKYFKKINPKKYPKVLIEARPSKIVKGEIGVFAVRNLAEGEIIGDTKFLNEKYQFSWKDYNKFDEFARKKIDDFCLGDINGFVMPEDFNYISIPWYLNHSCDGNIGFDKKNDFVAIRNIKADEELTYDYGLAERNPKFKMNCLCGAKKCRKIITGNDWKDNKFWKKNHNFMFRFDKK